MGRYRIAAYQPQLAIDIVVWVDGFLVRAEQRCAIQVGCSRPDWLRALKAVESPDRVAPVLSRRTVVLPALERRRQRARHCLWSIKSNCFIASLAVSRAWALSA